MLDLDTQLFWWINQHHCTAADWLLWIASQHWSWAIVLVAAFCFFTLRYEPKRCYLVLLGIILCFLLSDRISVLCFKDVFCRLRPCHALEGVRMFRTSCGGLYGFVSSHAANVFALAMFFALRYRRKSHLPAILLFLWACIVGYSRPYLGKHYPGDVICGALLGLLIGTLVFFIMQYIDNLISKRQQKKYFISDETK